MFGVTVMLAPVEPLDHVTIPPSQPIAVINELCPGQMLDIAQANTGGAIVGQPGFTISSSSSSSPLSVPLFGLESGSF